MNNAHSFIFSLVQPFSCIFACISPLPIICFIETHCFLSFWVSCSRHPKGEGGFGDILNHTNHTWKILRIQWSIYILLCTINTLVHVKTNRESLDVTWKMCWKCANRNLKLWTLLWLNYVNKLNLTRLSLAQHGFIFYSERAK